MIWKGIAVAAVIGSVWTAAAIDVSDRYRSPRNPERRVRATTELIVLHTTEAPAKSSLEKLCDRGECHFCVTEDGTIYRIVDRDKVAFHAGRSMWNGKEDVDEFAVGIECVGYHDKAMSVVQLRAIRDLVKELKGMYRLSDDKVVCHSHVAYGSPNKWHRFKHRGRKRCGMLFAMPSVRRVLELSKRPARDEDVRAKRLRVADDYLNTVLYGKVDTMKSTYANVSANSTPEKKSSGFFSWLGFGSSDDEAPKKTTTVKAKTVQRKATTSKQTKPAAKSTQSARPAATAKSTPPAKSASSTKPTTASKPSTAVKPAQDTKPATTVKPVSAVIPPRNRNELIASGYVARGQVNKGQSASKIVGAKWNAAETYYTIRDKVIPGNQIDPAKIEVGMIIWTKK